MMEGPVVHENARRRCRVEENHGDYFTSLPHLVAVASYRGIDLSREATIKAREYGGRGYGRWCGH
jgi:hypothetical protein